MTVVVSVKINDGVILAADSAVTFNTQPSSQIYNHANKIINLRQGLPIGAMVSGSGGIGSESIDTLLKDLRRRFAGEDPDYKSWKLDIDSYSVQQVSERIKEFLADEKLSAYTAEVWTNIRVCGYSAGRPLAEIWDVMLEGRVGSEPRLIREETSFGVNWAGEFEALDRLIFGRSPSFEATLQTSGLSPEEAEKWEAIIRHEHMQPLVLYAMPIQDAIDLARFLVETTINFVRFTLGRQKTVGGSVEIAAITKHEGFRWIQRKHFYPSSLNEA